MQRDRDERPTADAVPAGAFGAWLQQMLEALAGTADADVPCETCVGCCSSSQFVHVAPDEHDAIAHIPPELLVAAPRRPRGHLVMGYDQHGRCPMLGADGCSIYHHRPRTCRTYDCRVFAAAGIDVGDRTPLVAERARRWRFDHSGDDLALHEAVRAAAAFIGARGDELPDDVRPSNSTQLAVVAIEAHSAFLPNGRTDATVEDVCVAVRATRR